MGLGQNSDILPLFFQIYWELPRENLIHHIHLFATLKIWVTTKADNVKPNYYLLTPIWGMSTWLFACLGDLHPLQLTTDKINNRHKLIKITSKQGKLTNYSHLGSRRDFSPSADWDVFWKLFTTCSTGCEETAQIPRFQGFEPSWFSLHYMLFAF